MWMENDKVKIPEEYLSMSPEELKQAKEKGFGTTVEWIVQRKEETA